MLLLCNASNWPSRLIWLLVVVALHGKNPTRRFSEITPMSPQRPEKQSQSPEKQSQRRFIRLTCFENRTEFRRFDRFALENKGFRDFCSNHTCCAVRRFLRRFGRNGLGNPLKHGKNWKGFDSPRGCIYVAKTPENKGIQVSLSSKSAEFPLNRPNFP